jgi:WD40 repeat protein
VYDAFISYAHEDQPTATWLHTLLAKYWVPGRRSRAIFLDRSHIVAGQLSETIKEALQSSRYLVVCCSQAAADSPWVNREIDEFLRTHPAEQVLACLVGPATVERPTLPASMEAVERARGELFTPDLRGEPASARGRAALAYRHQALALLAPLVGLDDRAAVLGRARKSRRALAATAGLAAVIAGGEVSQARDISLARTLAGVSVEQLRADPEISLLLAVEAADLSSAPEAADALRRALFASRERANYGIDSASVVLDGNLVLLGRHTAAGLDWDSAAGHAATLSGGRYAMSADAVLVATVSDSTVRVQRRTTGELVSTLRGQRGGVRAVLFSPNGRRLAAMKADTVVQVWDVWSGRSVGVLNHSDSVYRMRFSPDGKRLATVVAATKMPRFLQVTLVDSVTVWDVETGRPVLRTRGFAAAFSPDGQRLLTAGLDTVIRMWAMDGPRQLDTVREHNGLIVDLAFSPNSELAVAVTEGGTARVWNVRSDRAVTLVGHTGMVLSAAFSADNQLVITGGLDNTARIWDTATGEAVAELRGHTAPVFAVAFTPTGRHAVTAGADRTVRIWDVDPARSVSTLSLRPRSPYRAEFGPDNQLLVAVQNPDSVLMLDRATGARLTAFAGGFEGLSADGSLLAVRDQGLNIWDIRTGKVIGNAWGMSDRAQFSADGKLITTTDDMMVSVQGTGGGRSGDTFDLERTFWPDTTERFPSFRCLRPLPAPYEVLVQKHDTSAMQVYDVRRRRLVIELPDAPSLCQYPISADGQWAITPTYQGATLWDMDTWQRVHEFRGHKGRVSSAAFSAYGAVVVTAEADGEIRMWDLATGTPLGGVRDPIGRIQGIALSPDGLYLAVTASDSTVRVYRCDACGSAEQMLERARTRIRRSLTAAERQRYISMSARRRRANR